MGEIFHLSKFAGVDAADLVIGPDEPIYSLRLGNHHYDGRADHIHREFPRSFATREELAVWDRPPADPQPCGALRRPGRPG